MTVDIAEQKSESIEWRHTHDDQTVIQQVNDIKERSKFDFEKEYQQSISGYERVWRNKECKVSARKILNSSLCNKNF
jgi:RecJ-like exonuclease